MLEAEVKAKHSEQVRILTERQAEKTRQKLINIRLEKEKSLARTMKEKDFEIMVKKE